MITQRQEQALFIIASGYTIAECAEIMNISRSSVEKLLKAATNNLKAENLRNAIYKAAKIGIIAFCCFAIFEADEVRRVARSSRRELIIPTTII